MQELRRHEVYLTPKGEKFHGKAVLTYLLAG
jgi:hypothetical protein